MRLEVQQVKYFVFLMSYLVVKDYMNQAQTVLKQYSKKKKTLTTTGTVALWLPGARTPVNALKRW